MIIGFIFVVAVMFITCIVVILIMGLELNMYYVQFLPKTSTQK